MNRRILGNILLITLLILLGSGLYMYFIPFEKNIASLHTFFAFVFILLMVLHIFNNKSALSKYISGKNQAKLKKFQSPLLFSMAAIIAIGVYYDLPLLNKIYAFGNQFRNEQIGKKENTFDYEIINLDKSVGNKSISVELKKGSAFQYPLFAVWMEDSVGNYIETLYISRVISSSTFDYGQKVGDNWTPAILRRPEALPYWSHKRGIQASDGLYVPLDGAPDLDAISGATPTSNFIINSKINIDRGNSYKVLIELNQSYDWNEYYTAEKFPEDKIYSGSGQVGQPSLIYAAEITPTDLETATYKIMKLIGHGHYSGQTGKLYTNLSNITSAKNIADRIILKIK